jgi:hypothetical protein
MVNEDAHILNRRVTQVTLAALFNRRLQLVNPAARHFAIRHAGVRYLPIRYSVPWH